MKKYSFWIATSLITFFVGFGAVLTWFYLSQKEIVEIEPVPLLENNCLQSKSFPGFSRKISEIKKGKSGYFPKGAWEGYNTADHFMNDWYGKFLKAMGEKSLLDISDEKEIYRFLWLRSFHHPVFVRIEKRGNAIKLFSKEFNGAGGYEPGKLIRTTNTTLDENQWCEFLSLLEKSKYWQMATEKKGNGVDGAQWILEGVKDSRYHVVDRWSPEYAGKYIEYQEACIYLLKLSGVDTDRLKDDLY